MWSAPGLITPCASLWHHCQSLETLAIHTKSIRSRHSMCVLMGVHLKCAQARVLCLKLRKIILLFISVNWIGSRGATEIWSLQYCNIRCSSGRFILKQQYIYTIKLVIYYLYNYAIYEFNSYIMYTPYCWSVYCTIYLNLYWKNNIPFIFTWYSEVYIYSPSVKRKKKRVCSILCFAFVHTLYCLYFVYSLHDIGHWQG